MFTINNPDDVTEASLQESFQDARYWVAQLEQGEEGTPHIQGYVYWQNARAWKSMRKLFPRAHIEPANGSPSQNKHYCNKPVEGCSCKHCKDCPPRLDGPWEQGELPEQGKRNDIKACIKSIKKRGLHATAKKNKYAKTIFKYPKGASLIASIWDHTPRSSVVEVVLVIGNPGTGKTRYAMSNHEWKDVYKHEAGSTWFDGYMKQPVVILDDFAGAASGWRLDYLLQFLDRYDIRLAVKGSFTWLHAGKIYITTNLHPYTWFGWDGRAIQYWALVRRIKSVRVINDDTTQVIVPGEDEWKRFWGGNAGPTPGDRFPSDDEKAWKVNITTHKVVEML